MRRSEQDVAVVGSRGAVQEERPQGDYRLLHTRLGPKQVICLGHSAKAALAVRSLFSDSQAPWPRHPSAAYSSSNVPPLLTGRPQPSFLFGEGGRLQLSWRSTEYPCHTNAPFHFILNYLNLFLKRTPTALFLQFFLVRKETVYNIHPTVNLFTGLLRDSVLC